MQTSQEEKIVKQWLQKTIEEPLAKILQQNSNLTKTQFETLLIDAFASELLKKDLSEKNKAKIRLSEKTITRGSFSRTLAQARKNVIRSIYTIMLLGYLGIIDTPSLSPFLELSNRLQTYTRAYYDTINESNKSNEQYIKMLSTIKQNLKTELQR